MGLIQHTATLQGTQDGQQKYASTNMVEYNRMAIMAGLTGTLTMEPDDTHVPVGHTKTMTATFENNGGAISNAESYINIGQKVQVLDVAVNGAELPEEKWSSQWGTLRVEVGNVLEGADTTITFRAEVLPH